LLEGHAHTLTEHIDRKGSRMLSGTPSRARTRTEWLAHIALVALIISIAANVGRALTLKARLASLNPPPAVKAGSVIKELAGKDASGVMRQVQLTGDRPTLVYVSRQGCGWCQRNERNMHAIGLQASTRYRILELSPEGPGPSGEKAYGVERLTVSEEVLQRIGARGTPYTVLLSPDGRVMETWFGAFGQRTAPSIARALAVELPGLMP
jgi:hypothetical protein